MIMSTLALVSAGGRLESADLHSLWYWEAAILRRDNLYIKISADLHSHREQMNVAAASHGRMCLFVTQFQRSNQIVLNQKSSRSQLDVIYACLFMAQELQGHISFLPPFQPYPEGRRGGGFVSSWARRSSDHLCDSTSKFRTHC